jgi:Fe-S cluster assembly protein SufD
MTAHITPLRSPAETQLIEQFRRAAEGSAEADPLAQRRREAFAVFAASGLPTRRLEAWHYTDLRAAMRDALPWAERPGAAALDAARTELAALPALDAVRLVLVDGFFVPELSDLASIPAAVRVSSLAEALSGGRADVTDRLGALEGAARDPAFALNTAFFRDGVVVEIAAGAAVERPLCVASIRTGATPAASAARSVVIAGPDAAADIVEIHAGGGEGASQTNDAIEFTLAPRARIEHVVLQQLAPGAVSVATVTADIDAHATFNSFAMTTGAAVSRRQLFVRGSGPHVKVWLGGVSLLGGRQHADTTLVVDHAAVAGESRELFRHIVDDEATGVFQGKVVVRPGAQKTDGGMKSNAILLSERAAMNNKPELEIFADDVVCGHGATCGALDEDHLFYLMARGLPRADAEALLLEAFAAEVVENVAHEGVREILLQKVHAWLLARTAAGPLTGAEPVGPAERAVLGATERSEP